MNISAVNTNQTQYKNPKNFSGLKVVFKDKSDRSFMALVEASKDTIFNLAEKYDLKMIFTNKVRAFTPAGYFRGLQNPYAKKVDSLLKIEIRDIDPSKNQLIKLIHNIFYKPFKAEKSIYSDSFYASKNHTLYKDNPVTLTPWLKEQEAKFLDLKKTKKVFK